jgi:proteasome lid subunit RPN8/RPN11
MAMTLRLDPRDVAGIRRHAESTYPHECCGILLGRPHSGDKVVTAVLTLDNERQDSQHNRFLITPETLFRAEKEARAAGLDILGFYHSHPDAPARPSEFDREHAWPTYSYIIVEVVSGKAGEMTAWLLSGDRTRFEPEQISDVVEV